MGLTISPFLASRFESYTTTPTANGITTLTSASTFIQLFTGTQAQVAKLPVASTLVLGFGFLIVNRSTQPVSVTTSSGSGLSPITVLQPGASAYVFCILASGTTAASWNVSYDEIAVEQAFALAQAFSINGDAAVTADAHAYTDSQINLFSPMCLFDDVQPVATSSTNGTEDDLFSNIIILDASPPPGKKIIESEVVTTVGSVTAGRQIKKYFDGTLIFDSGSLTLAIGSTFFIQTIIIVGSDLKVSVIVSVVTTSASTIPYATYTAPFPVADFTNAILKTTGIASGTGAASGDIINKFGTISIVPPGLTIV